MSMILPTELILLIIEFCIRRKTIVIRKPDRGYGRLVKLICFQRDLAQISEHVNLKLVCRLFYHKVWGTILDRFDGRLRISGNWLGLQHELLLKTKDKYCWLWSRVIEINATSLREATAIPEVYSYSPRLSNVSKITIENVRTPNYPVTLSNITDDEIIASLMADDEFTGREEWWNSIRKLGLAIILKIQYRGRKVSTQWIGGRKCWPGVALDITKADNIFVLARYTDLDFFNERMDILS